MLLVLCGYAFVDVIVGSAGWAVAIAGLIGAASARPELRQRGKDAFGFAGEMLSDATNFTDTRLQDLLRRGSTSSRAFVLRHEDVLRRLARRSRRFRFLDKVLDWLKKHRV